MDQDKAMFPCGANLSALVNDDSITGALELPLPFEGDDVLSLQWTRVEGLFISDEFAHQWGHHLKHTHDGAHYLGHFLYNGQPLLPIAAPPLKRGAEQIHECRFDLDGNDSLGSWLHFDGEDGFNVSSILGLLSRQQGRLELSEDRLTLVSRVEEGGRELKMFWEPNGGAKWSLELQDKLELPNGLVRTMVYEAFRFDLFAREMSWDYSYLPTDL